MSGLLANAIPLIMWLAVSLALGRFWVDWVQERFVHQAVVAAAVGDYGPLAAYLFLCVVPPVVASFAAWDMVFAIAGLL